MSSNMIKMKETCSDSIYKYILDKILENMEIIACSKQISLHQQSKAQGLSETAVHIQETCSQSIEMEEANVQLGYRLILEKSFDINGQMTYNKEMEELTSEGQADLQTPFDFLIEEKLLEEEQNLIKEDYIKKMISTKVYTTFKKMENDVLTRVIQNSCNSYISPIKRTMGDLLLLVQCGRKEWESYLRN